MIVDVSWYVICRCTLILHRCWHTCTHTHIFSSIIILLTLAAELWLWLKNRINQKCFSLWFSAVSMSVSQLFFFSFLFFIAKFFNLYLLLCLKCLSGRLQIPQRGGDTWREKGEGSWEIGGLFPIVVNTTLFLYVYTLGRRIRAPCFHCIQGERVIILLMEMLVKMGFQEKWFFFLKEEKSWQRWRGSN